MKNKRNKGFTLAELLIVIAIIGVLVAVSIPIFFGAKKRAMAASDAANVRSAKGAATAQYLQADYSNNIDSKLYSKSNIESIEKIYYYDAEKGIVSDNTKGIKAYGKSETDLIADNIMDDYAEGIPKGGIVSITFSSDGAVSAKWINVEGGGTPDKEISDDLKDFIDKVNPSEWEDFKKNIQEWGFNRPRGTVMEDDGELYIFFADNDYYQGDFRNVSLKELAAKYPNRLKKIDPNIKIKNSSEYKKHDMVHGGTIVKYSDEQYLVRTKSNKLFDNNIKPLRDNWVTVKMNKQKPNNNL